MCHKLTDSEIAEARARLIEISQRAASATAGPWRSFVEGRDHTAGSSCIRTGGPEDLEISGATAEDYDFIASARQDIPYLLSLLEKLL
jgi:hypothetical protein